MTLDFKVEEYNEAVELNEALDHVNKRVNITRLLLDYLADYDLSDMNRELKKRCEVLEENGDYLWVIKLKTADLLKELDESMGDWFNSKPIQTLKIKNASNDLDPFASTVLNKVGINQMILSVIDLAVNDEIIGTDATTYMEAAEDLVANETREELIPRDIPLENNALVGSQEEALKMLRWESVQGDTDDNDLDWDFKL